MVNFFIIFDYRRKMYIVIFSSGNIPWEILKEKRFVQTFSFLGHGGKYDCALERVFGIVCWMKRQVEIVCRVDTVCCFVRCFKFLGLNYFYFIYEH